MSDEVRNSERTGVSFIMDAGIITQKVKDYFEKLNPQLGFLLFRIESINPNEKPDMWVVNCSFKASFGSNKRLYYKLHVSNEGKIGEVNKFKEDEN